MNEDFADNAFVYASIQMMKVGAREDGWHTVGPTSCSTVKVLVLQFAAWSERAQSSASIAHVPKETFASMGSL